MRHDKCPERFYLNCQKAAIGCSKCKAGSGQGDLLYQPIKDIGVHPLSVSAASVSKVHKEANARGRENERKIGYRIERKLGHKNGHVRRVVRQTIASGALVQDGDLEMSIGNEKLHIECKHRGSLRRWYLTDSEYKHGVSNGVEVFAITRTNPDTRKDETVYLLSEGLFTQLVESYIEGGVSNG